MAKKQLPKWCKQAKIAMIEADLSMTDVADGTGMVRSYVSSIINGTVYSENAVKKISDFLKISDAEGNFVFPK